MNTPDSHRSVCIERGCEKERTKRSASPNGNAELVKRLRDEAQWIERQPVANLEVQGLLREAADALSALPAALIVHDPRTQLPISVGELNNSSKLDLAHLDTPEKIEAGLRAIDTAAPAEGVYEKCWREFVSLQYGDAVGICKKVEAWYLAGCPAAPSLPCVRGNSI